MHKVSLQAIKTRILVSESLHINKTLMNKGIWQCACWNVLNHKYPAGNDVWKSCLQAAPNYEVKRKVIIVKAQLMKNQSQTLLKVSQNPSKEQGSTAVNQPSK